MGLGVRVREGPTGLVTVAVGDPIGPGVAVAITLAVALAAGVRVGDAVGAGRASAAAQKPPCKTNELPLSAPASGCPLVPFTA